MRVPPKYKNSFFVRLVLSYTIFAFLLVGLAGGYLVSEANRMMVKEISQESKINLEHSRELLRGTILKKYEDILMKEAVSSAYVSTNSAALNYLLDNEMEGNLSRIYAFRSNLEILKVATEGVTNVTIYFKKGNYVVDQQYFYSKPENSLDYEFINGLSNTPQNHWMIRTLPNGNKVMTYMIKLPFVSLWASPNGYMYLDIDIDYLTKSLSERMNRDLDKLFVFDENGKIIIESTTVSKDEKSLIENFIGSDDLVEVLGKSSNKQIASYLVDAKSGWTYAMIRPMNSFALSSEIFKKRVIWVSFFVLCFGLCVSYLLSKQLNNPIKKSLQLIKSLIQTHQVHNVHDDVTMDSALLTLGKQIKILQSKAKSNGLKNLLLGTSLGLEQIDDFPLNGEYVVVHIRVHEGASEAYKERYDSLDHRIPNLLITLNNSEVAIIYMMNSFMLSVVETLLNEHISEVRRSLKEVGIRFDASIGTIVPSLEEISESYQFALQASKYHFIYGNEQTLLYANIRSKHIEPCFFSNEAYKAAIKAGDIDAAIQVINEMEKRIKSANYQLETVELTVLQLVTTLYHVVVELEVQKIISISGLSNHMMTETLDETLHLIRNISIKIATHVKESKSHSHEKVILKLKSYIDENLHMDLSLQLLSEVAGLVPAYISTLFGEVMDESFTEYVTRSRMEKAANLLSKEIDMTVAAISIQVGYRNKQYFHNKFKAYFGVTPVQYRLEKSEK
ncbi:hypothetical protein ASG89_20115 [Paenibacillus sp. Soil766]|nr:hypothetical protein ASG89_20115 [Paenibacillus sp. Soil766]